MNRIFQRLVSYLETGRFSFWQVLVCGVSFMILRNALEQVVFVSSDPIYWFRDLYHYNLSYLYLGAGSVLLLCFCAGVSLSQAFRVGWPFLGVLCIGPVIDSLLMGATGWDYTLGYLFPDQEGPWWRLYVTWFGPFKEVGVTFGMRVETFLVVLLAGFYVHLKTRSLKRTLLCGWAFYTFIFFYCAMPYGIAAVFHWLHAPYDLSDGLMVKFYAIGLLVFGGIAVACCDRPWGQVVLREFRLRRWLYYATWLLWGIVAQGRKARFLGEPFVMGNVIIAVYLILCIWALAWVSAVWLNFYTDQKEDALNAPHRPLVRGCVSAREALMISGLSAVAASIFSIALDFVAFFWVLVFLASYALYSLEPIRLKRWGLVSKLVIGVNTAAGASLGWHCATGQWGLPEKAWWLIVGSVWVASHWIDLKDIKGDKAVGLRTLPVMLGQRKAQKLIALMYAVGVGALGFLFYEIWFRWIVLAWGGGGALWIVRQPYRESGILWWTVLGTGIMAGLTAVGLVHVYP